MAAMRGPLAIRVAVLAASHGHTVTRPQLRGQRWEQRTESACALRVSAPSAQLRAADLSESAEARERAELYRVAVWGPEGAIITQLHVAPTIPVPLAPAHPVKVGLNSVRPRGERQLGALLHGTAV